MDDVLITVIFTIVFFAWWLGLRRTAGEIVPSNWGESVTSLNGWLLFAFAVLIASNSYHVFYGENTIENYFEEADSPTWASAFSSDIECQSGHSAQIDYNTEPLDECVDSFLDSHWLDTYEFTVATTFFGFAIFLYLIWAIDSGQAGNQLHGAIVMLALLTGNVGITARESDNTVAHNRSGLLSILLFTALGTLYGFIFPSLVENTPQNWMILDGAVLAVLMIWGILLAFGIRMRGEPT